MRSRAENLRRYGMATALVVASTGVAELVYRLTASTRVSMVFLCAVLLCAYLLGAGPAYYAAGLAFFFYNFYLVEPRFTFSPWSPDDPITLLVFLAVAMLTGNLTGRVRDQAAKAQERAQATAALFAATREFSASSEEAHLRQRLAERMADAADGQAAAIGGGGEVHAQPRDLVLPPAALQAASAAQDRPPYTHVMGGWSVRTLAASGDAVGAVAWRTTRAEALSADQQTLLEILADAGAAAIHRVRLAEAKTRAESFAQTERVRNALLSSISHDMRTPLAAILVAATSLRRYAGAFDAATREDLASTIQEEAERLDSFVANLLNMTRLEAGALNVRPAPFSIAESVTRAVARRGAGRALVEAMPRDLPEGLGDPLLLEQALGNVLENAARYAGTATVRVRAYAEGGQVRISVADGGPGVPEADVEQIFDKFFRSQQTAHHAGAGLGLSISRGMMEAMGGVIGAQNMKEGGLMVTLTVPVAT